MRDLSAALIQQMFYWGMDAAHPGGNLFQKRGFRKSPSAGLKGTSCYSLPKSNPWLAPADGEAWLRLFLENPPQAPPAKRFSRSAIR